MKRPTEKSLGALAVARTAQGQLVATGVVVAYCDAPTITIETPGGTRIHWQADLCEELPVPIEVVDLLIRSKGVETDEKF